MIPLIDHIEYLAARHDCVIVPGWGAFVVQYSAARIDHDKMLIYPPTRSIGYNASLNHNDGLIATSVARREGISYDMAVQAVAREVDAMRHQLDSDGEIAIGHLGVFRKNDNGTPIFLPTPSEGINGQFFGLTPVKATPLLMAVRQEAGKPDNDGRRDVFYLPISRNIFKIAASVALICGLGFVLSTPVIVDNNPDYASLAAMPTVSQEVVKIKERANAELFISIPSASSDATATVDTAKRVIPDTPNVPERPKHATLRMNDSDPYCLVIASHATRQQALKQIGSRTDLGMLESGGRFRVYVATGKSSAQARAAMNDPEFARRHPGAWVCRK